MLGLIYTFYYNGGDTFKYHTLGSRRMWEILIHSPSDGLGLLFFGADGAADKYFFSVPIINDAPSFFVARIAFLFDIFTFSTYSATAVLFAVFSFIGAWFFFNAFYYESPKLHRSIALAAFFIPSVFFWGSGILKDTVTLAGIGIATFYTRKIFIKKSFSVTGLIMLAVSLYIVFSVKKYILFCFVPSALLWVFSGGLARLQSVVLKIMLVPFVLAISILSGYYAIIKIGEGDTKYSVDKLAETAKITAYDIRYQTGREAGSGYELGELDGTISGSLRLLPQAINVSLFRPYLWEVRNPLMLLSALESLILLLLTIYVIYRKWKIISKAVMEPDILFCLVFSISFAFAVGVSTYNFGTLTRYKIPLLPFYLLALLRIMDYEKRDKKLEEFERAE